MMGVDEDGGGSAMAADYLHETAVSQLRKVVAAIFFWRRHAEDAKPAETGHHVVRYQGIAIDGGGVDLFGTKAP